MKFKPNIMSAILLGMCLAVAFLPTAGMAHVSEKGLVLLLPTDVYSIVGIAVVVLTIVLSIYFSVSPAGSHADTQTFIGSVYKARPKGLVLAVNMMSFLAFWALVAIGFLGPRNPLANLLPLSIYSIWWVVFPLLQAVFGDIWRWINPWTGPARLIYKDRHKFDLSVNYDIWPAILIYILAGTYALTDIAPTDPFRLAVVAACYWIFTFIMIGLVGPVWLHRCEAFTVLFGLLARLVPQRRLFGAQEVHKFSDKAGGFPNAAVAVFCATVLAVGSFDGLNETFWWVAKLGLNPLEFPGRSAVIWPNRFGLVVAVILLNVVFAATVWAGLVLIRQTRNFGYLFCRLALSLLPIALGYHLAHLFTALLINAQYFVLALTDPLDNGSDLMKLGFQHVTSSYLRNINSVRVIWLVQAGTIVAGHMVAIIMAHGIALAVLDDRRRSTIALIPMSIFMIGYTQFGLWLLASPTAF